MKKIFSFVLLALVASYFSLSEASDYYNRSAAVDYALKWSVNLRNCPDPEGDWSCPCAWNTEYRGFIDSDCANFVSQCLEAGGRKQIPASEEGKEVIASMGKNALVSVAYWFAPEYCQWILADWLCFSKREGSHSWTLAHAFYKRFMSGEVNVQPAPHWNKLVVGDVISFDYAGGNTDGNFDHTYIVTDVGTNDILVTAHTRDRRNSSWKQIRKENPKGVAAYWHILNPSLESVAISWLAYEADEDGNIIGEEITAGWGDVPRAVSYNIYIDAGLWLLAGRTNEPKITLTYTGYERIAISAVDAAGEEGLKAEIDLFSDEPPIILDKKPLPDFAKDQE